MGYTYTPTYYSGLQDTIASVCKSIFSRPGRRLTADQAASRRHADALKWQQESFHRILHLSALHREGIVPAADVNAFRASVLAALASPPSPQNPDAPPVLRDKLLFLQELLRAKCVSPAEFNAAKGPLVRRLAALGVAVDFPDADAGRSSGEEWAEIDLRDPPAPPAASDKPKHKGFVSPWKSRGSKKEQDLSSRPPLAPVDQNHHASVLMAEISPAEAAHASGKGEKGKRRHLTAMFNAGGGENKEPAAAVDGAEEEKESVKTRKKSSWGFDGLKKWKKAGTGNEDATAVGECPPPRSSYSECRLEASPAVAASPDAKRAKKTKLHARTGVVSASDLANDKVLVEETKKELSRIQAELSSTNRNLNFSDQQIEAISTKLPMDKSDLNTFFPKAWCDQHGAGVIDAAQKEFKGHVEEMEKQREDDTSSGGKGWAAAFEDDNFNPRAFSQPQSDARGEKKVQGSLDRAFSQPQSDARGEKKVQGSLDSEHFTNPFYDEKNPFLNQSYN